METEEITISWNRFSTKVDGGEEWKEEKQKDKVKELSIYKKQLSYWVRERICLVHQRAVDIWQGWSRPEWEGYQ